MDEQKRPRQGRPGREPRPGERVGLGLRVTPEMKTRLDREAAERGRSQSQEAELRIMMSFRDQDSLNAALEFAYGQKNASLLLLLGRIMDDASRREAALGKANWLVDKAEFKAVFKQIYAVFAKAFPGKDDLSLDFTGVPDDYYFTTLAVLELAIVQRARGEPTPDWTNKVIEMAGPGLIDKLTQGIAKYGLAQPRED
jgi:hypothetical protein